MCNKVKYIDQLPNEIRRLNLDNNDYFIVGSSVLTRIGGRINNDIEISLTSKGMNKIPFHYRFKLVFVDHIEITDNVDLFRDRYLCAGLSDKDILREGMYHEYGGFFWVNPEIEVVYKIKRKRKKDILDLDSISSSKIINNNIDWHKVSSIQSQCDNNKYVKYDRFRSVIGYYVYKLKETLRIKLVRSFENQS